MSDTVAGASGGGTIYALASGQPPCGVAVFRVSGPEAERLALTLTRRAGLPARQALYGALHSATDRGVIDHGLTLWFPGPRSFTGEDVVEFQVHGSLAVAAALGRTLAALGARPAEAGEFTRRALVNGRLDLTGAEGLADLIDAETEAQRIVSQRVAEGELARALEGWRAELIEASALLEAAIDFPEDDLPAEIVDRFLEKIGMVQGAIERSLAEAPAVRLARDGVRIALVGAPNAGKSSLYNALLKRDAAIVNARPGATRDVLEAVLDIAGRKVILADMAGLRDADDDIEAEGVARAQNWAREADLRLFVIDGAHPEAPPLAAGLADAVVVAKMDLGRSADLDQALAEAGLASLERVYVTVQADGGLGELRSWLEAWLGARATVGSAPPLIRERHVYWLQRCSEALQRAPLALAAGAADLAAEDLRSARDALGRLTGSIGAEDVLDAVFSRFCIGK